MGFIKLRVFAVNVYKNLYAVSESYRGNSGLVSARSSSSFRKKKGVHSPIPHTPIKTSIWEKPK